MIEMKVCIKQLNRKVVVEDIIEFLFLETSPNFKKMFMKKLACHKEKMAIHLAYHNKESLMCLKKPEFIILKELQYQKSLNHKSRNRNCAFQSFVMAFLNNHLQQLSLRAMNATFHFLVNLSQHIVVITQTHQVSYQIMFNVEDKGNYIHEFSYSVLSVFVASANPSCMKVTL